MPVTLLNQSAGVQNFRLGGQVGPYQTFDPTSGRTYGGISPSSGGVGSLQPFSLAQRYLQGGRSAGYGRGSAISRVSFFALQAYESANMAGRRIKIQQVQIGGVFESILNPAGRVAAGGGAFARSLASSATQGILGSGKEAMLHLVIAYLQCADARLDRDFLADQGIAELIDARNMQTASSRGRGFLSLAYLKVVWRQIQ